VVDVSKMRVVSIRSRTASQCIPGANSVSLTTAHELRLGRREGARSSGERIVVATRVKLVTQHGAIVALLAHAMILRCLNHGERASFASRYTCALGTLEPGGYSWEEARVSDVFPAW
jgi:hypothetical protein